MSKSTATKSTPATGTTYADRAGDDAAPGDDDTAALATAASPDSVGLSRIDERDESAVMKAMTAGGATMAPTFVKLEVGTLVAGHLTGRGVCQMKPDALTGEIKEIATWHVRLPNGLVIEFLSAHELERQLRPAYDRAAGRATPVRILRGADQRVGGRVVSRYAVSFPSPTGGAA